MPRILIPLRHTRNYTGEPLNSCRGHVTVQLRSRGRPGHRVTRAARIASETARLWEETQASARRANMPTRPVMKMLSGEAWRMIYAHSDSLVTMLLASRQVARWGAYHGWKEAMNRTNPESDKAIALMPPTRITFADWVPFRSRQSSLAFVAGPGRERAHPLRLNSGYASFQQAVLPCNNINSLLLTPAEPASYTRRPQFPAVPHKGTDMRHQRFA